MKVNELMTGNYVRVNGEIHQVYEINAEMHTVELWDTDTAELECDLEPVYLADEILEKNGFKNIKERIDNECDSFSNLFELNEDVVLGKHEDLYEVCYEKWNGDWDVYDHHPVFAIRHLHQLQNVLNIMGFEKEIKP